MKNRDLINAVESINAVAALKQLPIPVAFAIGLNLKAVRDHMEFFDTQRKKVLEKHTNRDDHGAAIPVYIPEKDSDGKPLLDAKGKARVIKDENGDVINKIHEGQVELKDPKAFNADIEELLNVDVSDELVIRKVRLSALLPKDKDGKVVLDAKGDKDTTLEPSHFANLLWMFTDDIGISEDANTEKPVEKPSKKSKA